LVIALTQSNAEAMTKQEKGQKSIDLTSGVWYLVLVIYGKG
jgi:hypothetical protein